jgi:hypothetical protein
MKEFNYSKVKPVDSCFGQILGTLYYHLEEALFDGFKYEIINIQINEENKTGLALIKINDGIMHDWYFDSDLDIWIIKDNQM